jgi:O-antigen/teichoic acid export membrane protein
VSLIAGGTALGQLVIALASPLLTRLYTPAQLGLLAVYASLLATLVPASSLRYEVAIPLPEHDEDALNLLAVALSCLLAVCALVLGVVPFVRHGLGHLTDSPTLAHYLWILPFGVLAAGTYQALSYWAVRRGTFGLIGRTRLIQAGGQAGAQVVFGAAGFGAGGLLLGDVVGRLGGAGAIAVGILRGRSGSIRTITRSRMREMAKRYRRFPLFGTWSALANSAGLHLTPLLVALTLGAQEAGWFVVCQRVLALPTTIVGQAVGQVYLHDAAEAARAQGSLRKLYVRTARRLLLFGIVVFVPMTVVAPIAFSRVFGSDWSRAGTYVQITAVMFLAQLVVSPLSQTLNVIGRQDLQLGWDISRLVAMVALFWAARAEGWSDVMTLGAFAGMMLLMYGGLGLMTVWAIGRSEP